MGRPALPRYSGSQWTTPAAALRHRPCAHQVIARRRRCLYECALPAPVVAGARRQRAPSMQQCCAQLRLGSTQNSPPPSAADLAVHGRLGVPAPSGGLVRRAATRRKQLEELAAALSSWRHRVAVVQSSHRWGWETALMPQLTQHRSREGSQLQFSVQDQMLTSPGRRCSLTPRSALLRPQTQRRRRGCQGRRPRSAAPPAPAPAPPRT